MKSIAVRSKLNIYQKTIFQLLFWGNRMKKKFLFKTYFRFYNQAKI